MRVVVAVGVTELSRLRESLDPGEAVMAMVLLPEGRFRWEDWRARQGGCGLFRLSCDRGRWRCSLGSVTLIC
jgi:hypothetical protein